MSYSYEQLLQRITDLTERFNLMQQTAKKTSELPQQEPLDPNSLIRLGAEHITVQQLLDQQNNLFREKYVFPSELSGEGSFEKQVAEAVNAKPSFEIDGDEIMSYILPVTTTPTDIIDVYIFRHKVGRGTYGTGGTQLTENSIQKGVRSEIRQDIVPFGDIGSLAISEKVNATGPYSEIAFTATINGEFKYYIYNGNSELIGFGNTQTEESDFVDMSLEEPDENLMNDLFYDVFQLRNVPSITDLTSLDQKFYILKATNTGLYYWASKADNIEEFENSRIFLKPNQMKIDIGEMIETGGYKLWQITDFEEFPLNSILETFPFQFWIKKGGGSTDFNGNRTVTRSGVPNINVGGTTVAEFLNNYFFPAVQPIVGLTNVSQSIEKGSNITDMAVNISFDQNDAGAATGYSLERNGVEISTTQNNSIDETNITAAIQYQGFVTYAASAGIPAGTKASPMRTITPRLYMWYAAVSAIPTTSAAVRAFANDVWNNQNEITLNTGTTETNFVVAVPSSKTTAANLSAQDITNNISLEYSFQNTVTVDLPTGTEEYRIYALSVDNAYPANAQHKITI